MDTFGKFPRSQNILLMAVNLDVLSSIVSPYPANASIWPNAVSILAHRQRRWTNIETTLGRVFVFAG